MDTLQFFKEVEIESKSEDLLNQIRAKLTGINAVPETIPQLPRRRVLHAMENKNWEIVEKSDSSHWVRFFDEVAYSEFMLLL